MENASKALLMAAGVLIGVLILSLGVYLYLSFSSSTAEMEKRMELDEINNFNNQFLAYDGKDNLTIYDVYTVANLAKESNRKFEIEDQKIEPYNYYVAVFFNNYNSGMKVGIEKDIKGSISEEEFITKYMQDVRENGQYNKILNKFTCQVYINENTGRVNKIKFIQQITQPTT